MVETLYQVFHLHNAIVLHHFTGLLQFIFFFIWTTPLDVNITVLFIQILIKTAIQKMTSFITYSVRWKNIYHNFQLSIFYTIPLYVA